jgi:threonine synthase
MLDILRKSGGCAVAVSDDDLIAAVKEIGSAEGVFAAPEGAACLPALKRLLESGEVKRDERVVIFNTGAGVKYIDAFPSR